MRARSTCLRTLVPGLAAALALSSVAGASSAEGGRPGLERNEHQRSEHQRGDADQDRSLWDVPGSGVRRGQQTSDGQPGRIAPPVPLSAARRPPRIANDVTWSTIPGLTLRQWDQTDARGTIHASLMTMSYADPALRVDYVYAGALRKRMPLSRILVKNNAVAGVNGDFFDIADTGAPLGIGVGSAGVANARVEGWNNAFYLTPTGEPKVGQIGLVARIRQYPGIAISNLNSPTVPMDGVGIYTGSWGRTAGYRVTDDTTSRTREVWIRRKDNRVTANRRTLSAQAWIGSKKIVLVGRGRGARALRNLKVGTRAKVRWRMFSSPKVAITGDRPILINGVSQVINDQIMHPRTAVGIDRDTQSLLFLVVDGRSKASRGYTMVEMATMLTALGAEDALNLDGGGSTTMVAPGPDAVTRVLNVPSDGRERKIPNGLGVFYSPQPAPAPTPTPTVATP